MPVEEQVVSIFAGVNGYLDDILARDVTQFEQGFLSEARAKQSPLLDTIRTEQAVSDETEAKLKEFLDGYAKTFVAA
jgi:F-type H+-transporting ATPase subunit alpha